ncbi:MAG: hypothetical protein Q7W55_10240 [Pseudohongiella sp.]|nr:hypothetical protein [Pseudohongiella sp.]
MLFITLALSVILIALIVTGLKTHQQQRHKDLAERDHSLPPLDVGAEHLPDKLRADVAEAYAPAEEPENAVAEPEVGYGRQTIAEATSNWKEDWKEECKQHRQAQRFEMALLCSDRAWPQSQSYEQAALTLRAAIKQARDNNSPDADKWLSALYRAAAESSMLYDKSPGEPDLRWQAIARSFSRTEVSQIDLPWVKIGANELRLLTKTDRKLMTQAWGEPEQHISARAYKNQKNVS